MGILSQLYSDICLVAVDINDYTGNIKCILNSSERQEETKITACCLHTDQSEADTFLLLLNY